MRTVLSWLATLVALGATLVAVPYFLLWRDAAFLPYNEEGRYFDSRAGVVHTHDEPWAFGILTCAALALAGGAAFSRSRLRREPRKGMAATDLRTFACFETDLPDDGEFSAGGDIVRPGGRNVAVALTEALRERGFAVTSPEQHRFYGWAFSVAGGDASIWVLLQRAGPWLLLSQDKTGLLSRLKSDSAAFHRRVLETLNQSLVRDARFRNLGWYTKSEYEKGNSLGPGSPAP